MLAGWKNRQAGTSRSRIAACRRASRSARSAAMSMSEVFGTRRLDTGCTCARSLTTRDSTRTATVNTGSDPVFSRGVAPQRLAHAVHAAARQLVLAHVRVVDLEAQRPQPGVQLRRRRRGQDAVVAQRDHVAAQAHRL